MDLYKLYEKARLSTDYHEFLKKITDDLKMDSNDETMVEYAEMLINKRLINEKR